MLLLIFWCLNSTNWAINHLEYVEDYVKPFSITINTSLMLNNVLSKNFNEFYAHF